MFVSVLLFYILINLVWHYNVRYLNEIFSFLVFYSAYSITPSLKVDKISIISPKNLMLLVFFMRLVICPITIFIAGPQKWQLPADPSNRDLFIVHLITFIAFFAFTVGWDSVRKDDLTIESSDRNIVKFRNNGVLTIFLLGSLVFIILGFYGSFDNYLKSLFVEDYHQFQEGKGKLVIFLTILFKYGTPFIGIITGLYFLDRIRGGVWIKASVAFLFIMIIVFLALGPSRNNMIFPSLAFLAACIPLHFRIKFRDFILVAAGILILLFLFQNIRKKENEHQLGELNRTEKFLEFVQVYFLSPHIMTPLLIIERDNEDIPFTIHASLLETLPVIGKEFRDKSGSYFYNVAYGRALGPDQVLPTYGEIYLNLGYVGVVAVFLITGLLYRKIHIFFNKNAFNDPILRAVTFYFSLIFNATIFYSYSVLGQFIYYNSILVLIVLIFRDKPKHDDGK